MHDDAIPNERLRHQREIFGWSRNYVAEKIESDPRRSPVERVKRS